VLRDTTYRGRYAWLPLLLWHLIPSAVWGNPNNLMDNNLLTFCLLALWCVLEGCLRGKNAILWLTMAGVCVYLGLMTKGPVALYPVAAPFFCAIISGLSPASGRTGTKRWVAGLLQSAWVAAVAAILFVSMLAFIPEARFYFEQYWEKRLGVVLSGAREDAELTGWARLSIFIILAKELIVLAVFYSAFLFRRFVTARRHKVSPETAGNPVSGTQPPGLLFLALGFSATLPLVFSARQSGMYIIPGLPMFALAAGFFLIPFLHRYLATTSGRAARFLRYLRTGSLAGLAVLCVYVSFLFGKPGREKALLTALPYIRQSIPSGEKVAVCDKLMSDLHAHTYLQRFHRLELSRDLQSCRFALTDRVCDPAVQALLMRNGFVKTGDYSGFSVYSKP
jgi:4-amino-4-deoxy-L-arabinose transferase-like glycosyltransferase